MQILLTKTPVTQLEADAVVIGQFAGSSPTGVAAQIDNASAGALARLMEAGEITGKQGELVPMLAMGGVRTRQVLIVGLGEESQFDAGRALRACSAAARHLASKPRPRVAFCFDDTWTLEHQQAGICGIQMGCQGQDLYRAEKQRHPFSEVLWSGGDESTRSTGEILGEAVNLTRRLVNEPAEVMYPESFADEVELVARRCELECDIWDAARLESESCGAMLAVARGSVRPPRLVSIRYQGAAADQPTLGLVGKGVTFDSGGLSLKPSDGMMAMKCDMAGAATVLGAVQAIAQLKLPVNVVGVMGLVENMVSGSSYKLGDVLTARNGRTIEVHNTDAEGRLVLADALSVTVDQGVDKIIDLATLTGACMVALGTDVAGLMSNNDSWCAQVIEAATRCGERVWQLPMFPEFDEQIKSEVADIKNVGEGRWGGAITAAKLLEQFVGDTPWTHIDIAGPSFLDKPKPWLDGGASGCMVRTLVEVARTWR